MTNPVQIQITRPSITGTVGFLVSVYAFDTQTGYYTDGEGEETPYPLTLGEEEYAVKLLEPYSDQGRYEPYAFAGPANREQDDRAAEDWASGRIGR